MSLTFTKLFSSITASTIWAEPDHTRLVWITMLAMSDQHGRIHASIPGLANMARVSIEKCEEALEALKSPDKYSRTKDHEGRRIEDMDGGWRLLNHAKYRAIRDEESIKESKRRYINARRAAERVEGVEQSRTQTNSVDRGRANTEAEADTEAKRREVSGPAQALAPPPAFLGDESPPISKTARVPIHQDFALPAEWGRDAEKLGWEPKATLKESEKFRQYWVSGKGAGTRKTVRGWRQSWSNWLSKAERFA